MRAKSLPHADRRMQLCVNRVQDWVSNNGFKFCTTKTVCMHFCNQRKKYAEPSIMLEKNPIKVVREPKLLGVVFNGTSSYESNVDYLKTLPQSSGYFKGRRPHRLWGRSKNPTLALLSSVTSKPDYGCIVYGAT